MFSNGDIWKYDERKLGRTRQVKYLLNRLRSNMRSDGDGYGGSSNNGNSSGGVASENEKANAGGNKSVVGSSSVLDVSCNLGFMLQTISSDARKLAIDVELYGLDISQKMVLSTEQNCANCKAVDVFDLSHVSSRVEELSEDEGIVEGSPSQFDYVLVSDVLYYLSFWSIPPLVFKVCPFCRKFPPVVEEQRKFGLALKTIAGKEVIFSDHQNNEFALSVLGNMGAVYRKKEGVYVL